MEGWCQDDCQVWWGRRLVLEPSAALAQPGDGQLGEEGQGTLLGRSQLSCGHLLPPCNRSSWDRWGTLPTSLWMGHPTQSHSPNAAV